MQEKYRFILFLIALGGLTISIYLYKAMNDAEYRYAHRDLELHLEDKKQVSEEKLGFMHSIIRAAQYSNYQIEKESALVEKMLHSIEEEEALSSLQKHHLIGLGKKYGVLFSENSDQEIKEVLDELNIRIQIVPVRLCLAQGILESAWGTSRFAIEGSAYFGIHCYEEDCGIPFGNSNQKGYVKSYTSLQASVEDYMMFLNSKRGTKKFRQARMRYLESQDRNMIRLAESLDSYSEIGGHYQKILKDLFKNYIPDDIDNY